ncbi:glycosyl transferase family 2 [Enterococcus sp. UD-01]|uniref:glycosyl transferase family 2 n=1 Tax=Enterococcus sp. UD-01 TaxID=3373911 RepID=UPI0038383797
MMNKLVITIVLYQTKFSQSASYQLLKERLQQQQLFLLVYDNSLTAQKDELFDLPNVYYHHDPTNSGLAKAYNTGLQLLKEQAASLLLLLDQDTALSAAYLDTIIEEPLNQEIGSYVPLIYSGERQISPVFSDQYVGRASALPVAGVYKERLMAINSGTVLTKEALIKLGSFNVDFPLDFLDHWLFFALYQMGIKVKVLPERLTHDLSVLDYEKVSIKRYESIIQAETLFYQEYDREKLSAHKRQLFLRTIKQFLRVRNRSIWRRTWSEYRLLMKGR